MTTSTTPVTHWIEQHAHALTSAAPDPLIGPAALREMVGAARVVALGASTRDAHELSVFAHRMVRFLVVHMGFRSLVVEGDDAASAALDAYVRTGIGDPRTLLAAARPFWRIEELLDTVTWLRGYNREHPDDPVRIAHPEPHREVTVRSGDLGVIEEMLADNVIRWHDRTGHKIVYWGGMAHTVAAETRTVLLGDERVTHRSAGGHLRRHYGAGYVSVGLTFDHGSTSHVFPPPPADFAEAVLGSTSLDAYLLDLRLPGPDEVRTWLTEPAKTRVIGPVYDPADDAAFHLSGGSLAEWFDLLAHYRTVTATRSIGQLGGRFSSALADPSGSAGSRSNR
ncbi:erythromycin esterase family protein [Nocardia veterana]|uniref:Erythromycin esterase family protein n=1 Tax=Nocardia veterana TaxID=132249 RepID=A0A7X6M0P5_9NOCA|nr:erythromycin esterase family protein [Nocardia veterana]NKY87207.1 erythromycin esterase family protein [Nocardia veterana]